MRTLYFNGRVYTGNLPLCGAFVVRDGLFEKTGSDEELLAGDYDEKVDLEGRFVCAGFNDSHMHLLNCGQSLNMARLAEHTDSLAGMLEYLRQFLRDHPVGEGQWLRGRGWNQDYFRDVDRMPDRYDLDAVSEDVPVMVTRACGHACAVNSKVLEICGITGDTLSPAGGKIGMRDGEPDGRFYDNAMSLVSAHIPVPDKEALKEMIRLACRKLNSYGITSAQTDDYCAFRGVPFETVNEAYRELEESGELTVRVYEQSNFSELSELKRFVEAGNVSGKGSDMFKIGPLKMLGDGSLGSRTAWLSRPYADDPDTCGFPLFAQEKMNEMIAYANRAGMHAAVHAIGDACLDMVLDAIEAALRECPREDHRHGIVHCQITRPDQLERIAKLKLHIYAQSIFLDYDNHIVEARAGKELASSSYSWKTLMEKGVCVSNGSDCPVEEPDVMRGIRCAVTRTSLDGTGPYLPEQAFTVQEALDSFTVCGARGSFEEGRKGLIKEGYLADFTVLDRDPFEVDPMELHTVRPVSVRLGGRCVFEAEN